MFLQLVFVVFSLFSIKSDFGHSMIFWSELGIFNRYKDLLTDIREQRKSPEIAKEEFKDIIKLIKITYPNQILGSNQEGLVFPLVGSTYKAVGGAGKGFYARTFDLFDQNITGSHPAHDIFIFDPDKDCKDNRTGNYIDIVSVGHGLVIATEKNWTESSIYKGGNYVWVYDLERGGLWYYAHHREVVVEPGQIVKPGDKLGEVGRTGFNALNKRSDTHLHLMYLELDENLNPKPINYFDWLKNAKTIFKSQHAISEGIKRFKNINIGKIAPIEFVQQPVPIKFGLKIK
jgi:hypothetical protein